MRLIFIYTLLSLLLSANTYAYKNNAGNVCADEKRMLFQKTSRTTLADTAEDEYDVQYVKLNMGLTNLSTAITGDVTTTARVIASSIGEYVFELNNDLTIDSVLFNGISATVITTGTSVVKIPLTIPLSYGSLFTVEIFYHGMPPSGTGFFTLGLNLATLSSGTKIMYTLSDPNTASDWWPCKQSLTDKIDSADIWVTVPKNTKAGSNGLLQSVRVVDTGHLQYKWHTRYPIDYYLLSVAVAPYTDYSSYMHFTGSTDSMLIQNFFYDTATFNPAYKANFDSVGMMVDYLSTLYGRYPFYKEKYGMCFSNLGGGMEHQTMTTIGATQTPLIAHELGHQWFGDCVTYQNWKDVWLSEGFATYTEQLFVEHFWGKNAVFAYRAARYSNVESSINGSVYLNPADTTNPYRIFNTTLTYYKGAAVVHMLRFLAPADSMFFQVLKNYQQKYAYGFATTDSLKAIAEAVYGHNLDTFFNQWIYGQGYPVYTGSWNQVGNKVFFRLNQSTSFPSSIKLFATPLEVTFTSAAGDTTIKVYNNKALQDYNFTWGNKATGFLIDSNNWILKKVQALSYDSTLKVSVINKSKQYKVYPNPTKDYWQIDQLQTGTELILTDINAKIIWKNRSNALITIIPGKGLPAGNYILHINDNKTIANISLVHW